MLQQVTVDARVTFASREDRGRCTLFQCARRNSATQKKPRNNIDVTHQEAKTKYNVTREAMLDVPLFGSFPFIRMPRRMLVLCTRMSAWILRKNRAESVATMLYQQHR